MLNKITKYLILIFLFLLPWQTRWIYSEATLNGRAWEYGTLSFYGTEILMWFIIIFTGITLFVNKEFWKNISKKSSSLWRFFSLMIGVALVFFSLYSFAVSPVKEVGVQFFSRLIGAVCLMICLARSDLGFKKMGLAFWSGGVLQGILAIWQFFSQSIIANKWFGIAVHSASDIGASVAQTADERWLRAYGSFGWPNSLGIYLAVSLVLGILLSQKFTKKYLPLFLAGQIIVASGLIFSFSRSAWLSAIIGMIFLLTISIWRKKNQIIALVLKNATAILLLIVAMLFLLPNLFVSRIQASGYLENISISERTAQYNVAVDIIHKNIIKGVGPGMYTYYLATNFEAPSYGLYQPVHNIYFLALSELGIILFVIFILGLMFVIVRIFKTNILFFPVLLVIFCFGFFDHYLWTLFTGQALFWAIFGLGLAKNEY